MEKKLPIVCCLDFSPSMNDRSMGKRTAPIDLMKNVFNDLIIKLRSDEKTQKIAQIAYLRFSTNIEWADSGAFTDVSNVQVSKISFKAAAHGCSNIGTAVQVAIDRINDYRNALQNGGNEICAPILVVMTDGDPDQKGSKVDINSIFHSVTEPLNMLMINVSAYSCNSSSVFDAFEAAAKEANVTYELIKHNDEEKQEINLVKFISID